jgi:hypothetical protein
VITLKLDGTPSTAAMGALEAHVAALYAKPGARLMGIVELAHIERVQPAPEADKDPSVKVKVTQLEIPNSEQVDAIREAQRALYISRTARGTLDEDHQLALAKQTIDLLGGSLAFRDVARLNAGLRTWVDYVTRVCTNEKLTAGELRHELDAIRDGLTALLQARDFDPDTGELFGPDGA